MQAINQNFLPWLNKAIPLTQHMGIKNLYWQENNLIAQLSLLPLVNDKHTAFGGGVVGVATLLGWCYTTLYLQGKNIHCPVVVKEASQSYLRPITSDFELVCSPASTANLAEFLAVYSEKQKARLPLEVTASCQNKAAFSFKATYVALSSG